MNKRIVKQAVAVTRDGKQVLPRIGDVYEFTDKEIFEIEKMNPRALVELPVKKAESAPKAEKPPVTAKGD